jgi:hypothetical protein
VAEAQRIVSHAKSIGITLRMMGAAAFVTHCPNNAVLFNKMDRQLTDIDLIGHYIDQKRIIALLKEFQYSLDRRSLRSWSREQLKFYNEKLEITLDLFLDKLQMCHTIDLRHRMECDYPTIPLADLLLEKTQIVHITEKDLKDLIILILEHPIGNHDKETINSDYISQLLKRDWGFYYTVTSNLKILNDDYLSKCTVLDEESKKVVKERINILLQEIDKKPKSLKWKLRSKIGPLLKWYNDVEHI